jgi:hypothetical protein
MNVRGTKLEKNNKILNFFSSNEIKVVSLTIDHSRTVMQTGVMI